MITNTNQGQKSLALLLDEIEEAELNSSQDLHRVIRQQALLVKALRRAEKGFARLRDCDWVITPHDRMDAVRQIAREVLSEITAILEGKEQEQDSGEPGGVI